MSFKYITDQEHKQWTTNMNKWLGFSGKQKDTILKHSLVFGTRVEWEIERSRFEFQDAFTIGDDELYQRPGFYSHPISCSKYNIRTH